MTDEESFQAALDADPSNHGMRLVFADWLAERGDKRADGYMWLGLNRKWPLSWEDLWFWWSNNVNQVENCRLPLMITEMDDFDLWRSVFSRRAAEDAFALAYPKLVAAHPQEFRLNLEAV